MSIATSIVCSLVYKKNLNILATKNFPKLGYFLSSCVCIAHAHFKLDSISGQNGGKYWLVRALLAGKNLICIAKHYRVGYSVIMHAMLLLTLVYLTKQQG